MWLELSLQCLFVMSILATPGDASSGTDDACEPTKCPELCLEGTGGYHYYYDKSDNCLKCECQGQKGPVDCGKDRYSFRCSWIDLSEDCKNSTIRNYCNFSCSQSGQLWLAATSGNLSEVNRALAAGANHLCQMTRMGPWSPNMTALHMAALGNHQEVIEALLYAGVDVNLQTTNGETPTYLASNEGNIDALKVLIEHNADVNIPRKYGMSPLMISSLRGHLSIAKALIDANASIDATGGWGSRNATALWYAVSPGSNSPHRLDLTLLLIQNNANVSITASDGTSILMRAALQGDLSVAKALINANASIHVIGGRDNSTALHYAASHSPDIALLLIELNADVNIPNSDGTTPLIRSVWGEHLNVVKALINANARLDVTGGGANATALYYAISYDYPDIALLLIEHNADVNIAASDGDTPLMKAIYKGQLGVVNALINANVSLDAIGGVNGASALHYTANCSSNSTSRLKRTSPIRIIERPIQCSDAQDIALILLESGADAMILNKNGQTPAALARDLGHNLLADLIESYTMATTTIEDDITSP